MTSFLRRMKGRLVEILEMPQLLREVRAGIENQSQQFGRGLDRLSAQIATQAASGLDRPAPSPSPQEAVEITALTDIPWPKLNVSQGDPLQELMGSDEFRSATDFFLHSSMAQRSLVSPQSHALLYCLIRLFEPKRVIEIGTFKAATTEAMARGILANGSGTIDTVDPFGHFVVPSIMASWPPELANTTTFHPVNSMAFFAELHERQQTADLIFIDGNHDYEFALFDVESAGRFLAPGGFLAIDNIAQPGPFLAMKDFLARHPGWYECGVSGNPGRISAYNSERTRIENTDLCILRSPSRVSVNDRPSSPGQIPFTGALNGIRLEIADRTRGLLYLQCVLRTFGDLPSETVLETSLDIEETHSVVEIPLKGPAEAAPYLLKTVEPWLVWKGTTELSLVSQPTIY